MRRLRTTAGVQLIIFLLFVLVLLLLGHCDSPGGI